MKLVNTKTLKHNDDICTLSDIRASGLSLPAILVLSIVNENYSAKYPQIYIGEVEAVFTSAVSKRERHLWTYSAIGRMLRVLAKKGYLNCERDGRFVMYGMTRKGIDMLVSIYGEEADHSRKLRLVK